MRWDSRAPPWSSGLLFDLLFLFLLFLLPVKANYRQYHMDNADICRSSPEQGQVLYLGTGASLFQLEAPSERIQPNMHHKATLCEIHIKAPKDYGLVVHVEKLRLRVKPSGGCVDYIQFGQDDRVPFYTSSKSRRLCGEEPGFEYNDPKGDLLIWISLGGRKGAALWEDISLVNLTLIVTAYQVHCPEPGPNQVQCAQSDHCIWNKYVCDRHLNCPGATDENSSCLYDKHQVTSVSANNNSKDGGKLEILSLSFFVVAFGVIGLCGAVFIFRYFCWKRSNSSGSCELGEQTVFSLRDLSNTERVTQENVYLPLHDLVQRPLSEDEPPPAYEDIFPLNLPQEETQQSSNPSSSVEMIS